MAKHIAHGLESSEELSPKIRTVSSALTEATHVKDVNKVDWRILDF